MGPDAARKPIATFEGAPVHRAGQAPAQPARRRDGGAASCGSFGQAPASTSSAWSPCGHQTTTAYRGDQGTSPLRAATSSRWVPADEEIFRNGRFIAHDVDHAPGR